MQLVAYGAQDVYMTNEPQITFWKKAYKRHTNFSLESIAQTFQGAVGFGKKATCQISRNGDLIHKAYLQVTLPKINPAAGDPSGNTNTTDDYTSVWVKNVGHALIDSVEITIGGQPIDKHTGEWMHIWNELTNKNLEGLNKMTGNHLNYNDGILYIPLHFWFNNTPGMALPLIALQYHEVRITFNFASIQSCLVNPNSMPSFVNDVKDFNAELYIDYVYIDTEERRRFAQSPHEYLIQQVQFTGDESVRNKTQLNFNHPCKELIWVVQNDSRKKLNFEVEIPDNSTTFNSAIDMDPDTRLTIIDEVGPVESANIQLNGHDRFSTRPGSYFNLVQPYQHHTNVPSSQGIYCYSFALEPESDQPSGSCNMSRIDNAVLNMKIKPSITLNSTAVLKVFATNFNVLRIMGGMGGLAFAD